MATLETVPLHMNAPAEANEEKRGRMAVLAAAAIGFGAVLPDDVSLVTPLPIVAAIMLPWVALSIFLITHRATYGREGPFVDLWSNPHFMGGVMLGMPGVGVAWVIAVVWELIEIASHVSETPSNRVMDVLLAVVGSWLAVMLLRP